MMGIEIIPNFHPIFVHFTIALLSISSLLYLAGFVFKKEKLLEVARWSLWAGFVITIGTVLAGFHAYNTVTHDGPSHAAMTDHKNWALATASTFAVLAIWSFFRHRGGKPTGIVFVILILFASSLLAVTGYKGGEAVYRYGLGVMSLPKVSGDGGHGSHEHADGKGHGSSSSSSASENTKSHHGENGSNNQEPASDGHSNHQH